MPTRAIRVFLFALSLVIPAAAHAQDAVKVGALTTEAPTLISLGFDWMIEGDDNRNAKVMVSYRKVGSAAWREGLPLFRLQDEKINVPVGSTKLKDELRGLTFTARNSFSGSLFDLTPGTEYEMRFTLTDPDGVTGEAVRSLRASTRPDPQPAKDGRIFHVYPKDWKGKKEPVAFDGILAAYYYAISQSDHFNAYPPRVKPGDIILVHAGVYKDARHLYGGFEREEYTYGAVFDGTYYLRAKGTAERPIVIKAAGDGDVIFDGGGNAVLFDLSVADYHYFEGITVRNTEVGFLLGRKDYLGSSGFTLKHSRIENVGRGVHGDWAGSRDITITDNVFVGRHRGDKMLGWTRYPWKPFEGYPAPISGPGGSEYAVKIYGRGNVVAFNDIRNFHDGITHATYGLPEETRALQPESTDFYNNYIFNTDDNCIEGDGAARNIRIFRNLCFNSAQAGLSLQPLFGGPAFIFRNVLYNQIAGSLKFTDGGAGTYVANNTIIGENRNWWPFGNQHYVNNLFLGQGSIGLRSDKDQPAPLFDINTYTKYDTSDYNGFAPWPATAVNFQWTYNSWGEPEGPPVGYKSFKDYVKATGQDRHSILIGYDTFRKASPPDMKKLQTLYDPKDYDLRLAANSKAIDAGTILPGITDGYTGKAPDMGAYESGKSVPHYGPRP